MIFQVGLIFYFQNEDFNIRIWKFQIFKVVKSNSTNSSKWTKTVKKVVVSAPLKQTFQHSVINFIYLQFNQHIFFGKYNLIKRYNCIVSFFTII